MRLTIFGTGYVGLVTGACLAEVGHEVTCVDIDKKRIESLLEGKIPIFEPGLEPLVQTGLKNKKLSFTSDPKSCLDRTEAAMICVGTPDDGTGATNLKYVIDVANTLAEELNYSIPVFIKSTVPVGTSLEVEEQINAGIQARGKDFQVFVASNPEFLKEGSAVSDFLKPDRIILGTDEESVIKTAKDIYQDFNRRNDRMLVISAPSSELTKYASNALLATKISFMNQLSHFCTNVGADIEEVRLGMGSDPRIGESFLYAGCGFGGSCFPKDIDSLLQQAQLQGTDLPILEAVREVNKTQKDFLSSLALDLFDNNLSNKTITIWGLTFKPNTNDTREAPSLTIIKRLLDEGAKIKAYDPIVSQEPEAYEIKNSSFVICQSALEAATESDCLIICTEWKEFWNPNLEELDKLMTRKLILDGRNILNSSELLTRGFEYKGVGRSV